MFTLIAQIISRHIILCSFDQRNVICIRKKSGKIYGVLDSCSSIVANHEQANLNTHLIAFEIDCSVPTNRNDAGSSIQGSL